MLPRGEKCIFQNELTTEQGCRVTPIPPMIFAFRLCCLVGRNVSFKMNCPRSKGVASRQSPDDICVLFMLPRGEKCIFQNELTAEQGCSVTLPQFFISKLSPRMSLLASSIGLMHSARNSSTCCELLPV